MKKIVSFVLAVCLAFGSLLAGCGGGEDDVTL